MGGDRFSVHNKPAKDLVRVFTTQGALISETSESQVKDLAVGIYIVTVGNKSFKAKL